MGDLFGMLKRRVDDNARKVVDACAGEIAGFHAIEPRSRASMMEFAVVVRRRTVELAASGEPLLDSDLAFIESVGELRGTQGVAPSCQRGALALHAAFTLREISEAAGPADLTDTMRVIDWLARYGPAAQAVYTRGYFRGYERFLPAASRICLLATMVLHDDPMADGLAGSLGVPVTEHYLVMVVRMVTEPPKKCREEVVSILLQHYRVPFGWQEPDEFVALVPYNGTRPEDSAAAEGTGLALARAVAEVVGLPCSVGTAHGRRRALVQAAALARKVSRVAPIERVPRQVYGVPDVFTELGAMETPQVDQWLRETARRLGDGPDLVPTLDAYYRNDMNRLRTAESLHIHPRTLDYRLRRVRELVGIEPGSTHGIRVLSTTVTRLLAGAWTEHGFA
ncbi:PucR family transcriptional regulator [Nonomuraea insulae]|uniref:PucR family transcriptional regulator n=1 Tax=Nonomuraea insulae TaxID=1616787 RepID=A0ABW1CDG3_9ACTN